MGLKKEYTIYDVEEVAIQSAHMTHHNDNGQIVVVIYVELDDKGNLIPYMANSDSVFELFSEFMYPGDVPEDEVEAFFIEDCMKYDAPCFHEACGKMLERINSYLDTINGGI